MSHPTPVRSHTLGPTGQPRIPLSPAPALDLNALPTEQFTQVVAITAILPTAAREQIPVPCQRPPHPVDVRRPRRPRQPVEVVERRSSALRWVGVGFLIASAVTVAAAGVWAVWHG